MDLAKKFGKKKIDFKTEEQAGNKVKGVGGALGPVLGLWLLAYLERERERERENQDFSYN